MNNPLGSIGSPTNTPSRFPPASRPNSGAKNSRASSSRDSSFTRINQDQQARNKEPDNVDGEDESSDEELPGKSYDLFGNESYASVIARREAVAVLDNPELLMMHAQARNESIPATRLHFLHKLAGCIPTQAQELAASDQRLARLKMRAESVSQLMLG